ncbi:MAG TPA: hypothetical protein VFS43_29530 [Polyangiaceae bacterium]|nr:hypothetical protein [Polyangiaceae bacterium]
MRKPPDTDRDPTWPPQSVILNTPYVVRRQLGRGGMGSVYEVHHRDTRLVYACKVLSTRVAAHPALAERVVREAEAGAVAGEIFVDGKTAGPYADGVELTLETGLHDVEVRDGQRVVARARVRVEPGGRSEAKLTRLAEPPPPPTSPPSTSVRPFTEPPPVVIRPRPSAWPWALGDTAPAGRRARAVRAAGEKRRSTCGRPRGRSSRRGARGRATRRRCSWARSRRRPRRTRATPSGRHTSWSMRATSTSPTSARSM